MKIPSLDKSFGRPLDMYDGRNGLKINRISYTAYTSCSSHKRPDFPWEGFSASACTGIGDIR